MWSGESRPSNPSLELELVHLLAQTGLGGVTTCAHLKLPMSSQRLCEDRHVCLHLWTFYSALSMAGAQSTSIHRTFGYTLPLIGIGNPIQEHTQWPCLARAR